MENLKQIFSSRLRYCIKKSGLRNIEIGRQIGASSVGMSQFLAGANFPSIEKLVHLANVLKTSTDFLLGRTDEPNEVFLRDNPEGVFPYYIMLSRDPIHGSFKYAYGIFPSENREFLYLNEQPGGEFIWPNIIKSSSQSYFLSLTSILNHELKFEYNPFNRGNTDILISTEVETEKLFSRNLIHGIGIEKHRSNYMYDISPQYQDFVRNYLPKSFQEKVALLRDIAIGKSNDAE